VRVAVGGIIHERETLPAYLNAMEALNFDGVQPVWTWVVDGHISVELPASEGHLYAATVEMPGPRYARQGGLAGERSIVHGRLACLRNILADLALGANCDALLTVDSDIIVPPDLLLRLVETGRPWVSALVRNGPRLRDWNVYMITHPEQGGLVHPFVAMGDGAMGQNWPGPEGSGGDPRERIQKGKLSTGAVCLYRRELLEAARWAPTSTGAGEDTGFGMQAHAAGFEAWYLPIRCRHLTVDGYG